MSQTEEDAQIIVDGHVAWIMEHVPVESIIKKNVRKFVELIFLLGYRQALLDKQHAEEEERAKQ